MRKKMKNYIGLALLVIGSAGFALAGGGAHVPEIDTATGVGALALLSGALLVIRGRKKR
jgi:hypothetical protein